MFNEIIFRDKKLIIICMHIRLSIYWSRQLQNQTDSVEFLVEGMLFSAKRMLLKSFLGLLLLSSAFVTGQVNLKVFFIS